MLKQTPNADALNEPTNHYKKPMPKVKATTLE